MPNTPLVSVIIPCRNEEKFISACLDSIIANDYPKDKMEVLVMDGMSDDRTREIVSGYTKNYPFIKLLDNSKKITSWALNTGIKQAEGEIIVRMDSHSTYDNRYISNCLKYLYAYKADNVGGIWKIMPRENTLINKAIVFVSASIFAAGDAYYRRGYNKGPKWVDTVFGGCYRKEIFDKVGLFNENLERSQDMEFNIRLRKAGGKILLAPEIVTYYYPKSTLKEFLKHNFQDGLWAVYPLKFIRQPLKLRHYVPLFLITGLLLLSFLYFLSNSFIWLWLIILFTLLYLLLSLIFAGQMVIKEKDPRYFFLIPLVFIIRHFGYGFGSIVGLIKIALAKEPPGVQSVF